MLARPAWTTAAALILALALGHRSFAATLAPSAFVYDGHSVTLNEPEGQGQRIEAWWNPRNSTKNPRVLMPGFHVSFFGRGAGCAITASNGPVARLPADLTPLAETLTGLRYDPQRDDLSFAPTADSASCPTSSHMQPGPAFVLVRQGPPGGIGLFTHVGDGGRIPGSHFWRQFSAGGQNATGANVSVEGTFVAWRFNWRHNRTALPWVMIGAARGDIPRVLIESTQSVASAAVAASPRGVRAAQVKQQYAASFINPVCQRTVSEKKFCQIRYLFHTALIRGGRVIWQDQAWANHAQLLFDPTQGGMPIFYGPLKQEGQVTTAGTIDLWRSRGDATQHAPFRSKKFTAEINFPEFVNGLRVIAARTLAIPAVHVDEQQLARLFGSAWNDPSGWRLLDVNAGQEVHNEDIHQEAYIGGAITRLEVRASTFTRH
jgi:hypothetical protein